MLLLKSDFEEARTLFAGRCSRLLLPLLRCPIVLVWQLRPSGDVTTKLRLPSVERQGQIANPQDLTNDGLIPHAFYGRSSSRLRDRLHVPAGIVVACRRSYLSWRSHV